jgi:hypothetical protein
LSLVRNSVLLKILKRAPVSREIPWWLGYFAGTAAQVSDIHFSFFKSFHFGQPHSLPSDADVQLG